ncbi:MAG: hypothetical protein ACYC7E_02720 [Armatimonadota bacterium]
MLYVLLDAEGYACACYNDRFVTDIPPEAVPVTEEAWDALASGDFRWVNRTYAVDAVNQRWTGKNGDIQICYFAVSAVGNAYKLAFNTKELTWHLEEVYAA